MRFQRLGDPGHEVPVALDETGAARDPRMLTTDVYGPFLADDGVVHTRVAPAECVLPVIDTPVLRTGTPAHRPGEQRAAVLGGGATRVYGLAS